MVSFHHIGETDESQFMENGSRNMSFERMAHAQFLVSNDGPKMCFTICSKLFLL